MSNSKEYFQTIYKPKQTSSTLKKPAAIMDLNNFTSTAKWVSIMTTKAKAALEDKATGASKKWKPNETGLNTTI
jgi:hypothetical protein